MNITISDLLDAELDETIETISAAKQNFGLYSDPVFRSDANYRSSWNKGAGYSRSA